MTETGKDAIIKPSKEREIKTMMTKIYESYINAERKNDLYKAGYRYIVECDYRTLETTDPWSGMPNTTNNICAFTDKAEAEAFALTQIWVFNPDVHASVEELPEHTRTWDEINAEEVKRRADLKAKKAEAEARNAAKAGMTVEEYRAKKNKERYIKTLARDLAKAEAEVERLREKLAELRA